MPKLVAFFVAAVVLFSPPLLAEEGEAKEQASKAFEEGVYLYDGGFFDGALEKFEKAYSLMPHPSILYNIGWCQSQLGRTLSALATFLEYLERTEKIPEEVRAEVDAEVARLEKLVCKLTIVAGADKTTVTLGSTQLGESPLAGPFHVLPGEHTVTGTKAGHETATKSFACAAGTSSAIVLDMVLLPTTGLVTIDVQDSGSESTVPMGAAKVEIDGTGQHQAPLEIELPPGEHTVTATAPGFLPLTRKILVQAGQHTHETMGLAPEIPGANLEIATNTDPSETVVTIDGREKAADAWLQVDPGEHDVAVDAPGYLSWKGKLKFGDSNVLAVKLLTEKPDRRAISIAFAVIGIIAAVGTTATAVAMGVTFGSSTKWHDLSAAGTAVLGTVMLVSFGIAGGISKRSSVKLTVSMGPLGLAIPSMARLVPVRPLM